MIKTPSPGRVSDVVSEIERTGHSLRRGFLSIIAGVIVVSAALLALILLSLRAQTIRSGERLVESLAHVIAEQTNSSLQTINQRLQLAASRIAPLVDARPDEALVRPLLAEQILELPHLRALSVADAQGRIVYSTHGETPGQTVVDREYFQAYLSGPLTGFRVGPPVRGRVSGTWLISATWPLRSAAGELKGLLIAAIEPAYFDAVWREVDVGEDGSIALFRRDGILMMRSPFDERAMGRSFPNMPVLTHVRTSAEGSFQHTSPIDGIARILGYRTLTGDPNLVVVLGRSYRQVLLPWRQFAMITVSVWAVAVLVIVVLAVFLERAGLEKLKTVASGQQMAQRLTLATEASSIGVWDWDLKADRWYATPTYFAMLGYESDQGVGLRKQWLEHVHPEDKASVAANIQAALEGVDVPYRHDVRVLHADGSYRWVSVIGRVLERDQQGKPSRLLGVMMDITETKKASEALQRQQAELRVLFDLTPAMIWFKDTEDRILRINQRAASVSGRSVEEIEGRPSREIYPQEAERFYADDQRVIQTGEPSLGIVERLVDSESREFWVRTDKVPYRDQDGRVIGIVVMALDITEGKRAEETLREREELFSAAFEHAPIGMALVSPEGRWLRVNRALCDLVGYSDAELRSRSFQEITHPEDLDADLESVRQLLAGNTSSYQMEKRYVHASGRYVHTQLSVSLIRDGRGAPRYFIAQIQDITGQKRSSAALESSLHEKEGLLKEVHHRVKNNLQVITSLLRLEAGRSDEPSTKAVLKDMRGRIHSMALLHEMLYRTTNFARVDLADYLRRLATQLVRGQNAVPGAVRLSLDLKPVEVGIDQAIPAALIVNELLSNALKHAFPEGRAGELRLALDGDAAGLVRLCVSDTGVGLSPDFETRRTRSLGLQLVSDLSRQLGGKLEVERTPEARFTVTFPLTRESRSAAQG